MNQNILFQHILPIYDSFMDFIVLKAILMVNVNKKIDYLVKFFFSMI